MRAFYVTAEWSPKEGYKLSQREADTQRAARGNYIWKNIKGQITNRPVPKITSPSQVLLKVGYAGICGTDAHLLQMDDGGYTKYNGHSKYPIITGHEFSGEVIEIGKNVNTLKIGDLVGVESMHWCGCCSACRMGMFNQCQLLEEPGLTYDGGFTEYAVVDFKYCYLLNDIVEYYGNTTSALELGALIEPTGVAYNGLFVRGGGMRPGGHAVVFGAGPIGLAAIALLKTSGAAKLFCFDINDERKDLAIAMGADEFINPIKLQNEGITPAELLMEKTNGFGISFFAECSGATNATYPIIERSLAIGGKVAQIGHGLKKTTVDMYPFQFSASTISGSNGQSGQGIYSDVIALMASGRIDVRKMVTGRFPLEKIEEGLKLTLAGKPGKILVSSLYK